MLNYRDIKPFTREACYHVTVGWDYLDEWLKSLNDRISNDGRTITKDGLDLTPDFQRGHVWTQEQKSAYIEYALRGGASGRNVYFNNPSWGRGYNKPTVLVDGLQRITAVQQFLEGTVEVFGGLTCFHFEGRINCNFDAYVHNLATREEVLEWYIGINSGGTPHSPDEINRIKELLKEEREDYGSKTCQSPVS